MREKTYTRWVWNEELQDDQLVEYGTGKYHFDEEDKIAIVSEYVGGHVPASQIIEKYHISSRQVLFNWMDKYVNEKELVSLQGETNPSDPMAKKSPEDRVKELEAENKKLQKALELEKLRPRQRKPSARDDLYTRSIWMNRLDRIQLGVRDCNVRMAAKICLLRVFFAFC